MSDAYDFRPGGSLKLKGADGGVKKYVLSLHLYSMVEIDILCRKKHKSKSKPSAKDELLQPPPKSSSPVPTSSGRESPAAGSSKTSDKKTDAERRFEATQRKRVRITPLPAHLCVLVHQILIDGCS